MDIHTVYLLMLSDKFQKDEIEKLALEATEQIKYSIQFLTEDLQQMGFSTDHAQLTAIQIAPKPILYSLIIRNRILDDPVLVPEFPNSKAGRLKEMAYRKLQYQLLAPEFTAFLFDQIIDEYNAENENTLVKAMIDEADRKINSDPDFYYDKILRLLNICFQKENDYLKQIESENLTALGLLVPLIFRHQKAGASKEEIKDLLYTVSDVLTHEQIASNAFNKGKFGSTNYKRPVDYLDHIQGVTTHQNDNPVDTVARGILRNQGLLMVAISQYMIIRSPFYYDRSAGNFDLLRKPRITPIRKILLESPKLIRLIRFFELIVRAGDDVGDLEIDRQTLTPNCILLGSEGIQTLMKASGIEDESYSSTSIDPDGKLKKDFLSFFKRVVKGSASNNQLLAELKNLKTRGINQIGIRTDHTSIDDSHLLARILNEVAYGAIFNAIFNDTNAENMGNSLLQESIN